MRPNGPIIVTYQYFSFFPTIRVSSTRLLPAASRTAADKGQPKASTTFKTRRTNCQQISSARARVTNCQKQTTSMHAEVRTLADEPRATGGNWPTAWLQARSVTASHGSDCLLDMCRLRFCRRRSTELSFRALAGCEKDVNLCGRSVIGVD